MKDFIYYRCGGFDAYRFGGERICSNSQLQGTYLETTVWREVSSLLMNPERIQLEHPERSTAGTSLGTLEILRSQRTKLQHAMERLIDSFTEGLIEKDQFTSRIDRTKTRIANLDAKIKAGAGDVDQLACILLATRRLCDLAAAVGPELAGADWQRKREFIRTLVQRIDIDTEVIKIIFRVPRTPGARILTPSRSLCADLGLDSQWTHWHWKTWRRMAGVRNDLRFGAFLGTLSSQTTSPSLWVRLLRHCYRRELTPKGRMNSRHITNAPQVSILWP
jgi:hypothetical protein